MGKLQNEYAAATDLAASNYTNSAFNKTVGSVTSAATDAVNVVQNSVLLTLSKAWIGLGMVRPADTTNDPLREQGVRDVGRGSVWDNTVGHHQEVSSPERVINRFDYKKLWSLQFGDYFVPVSQTFTVRAKKRLNVSSLVDGIDIIQQTRKESKTIDCTLRISLNENQKNLQIVDANNEIRQLARFLSELYETDAVFAVKNDTINNTFGVTHVIMSEYKFLPRTGMGTYTFEFSLMEVIFGDNVMTFDLREIGDATEQQATEQ